MDTFGSFTFRPGVGSSDILTADKENTGKVFAEGGQRKNGSSSLIGQNSRVPMSPLMNTDT